MFQCPKSINYLDPYESRHMALVTKNVKLKLIVLFEIVAFLGVFPFSTFFCESLVVSLLNSQNPKDIIAPPCADNGATWPLVHLPESA